MHEAGLGFQLLRYYPMREGNIRSESGPPLPLPSFFFFPFSPLPSFFLWARGSGVLSYLYISSEKIGRDSDQRECKRLEGLSTPVFASRDSTLLISLNPFYQMHITLLPHFYLLLIHRRLIIHWKCTHKKCRIWSNQRDMLLMPRNHVGWFVFSPQSLFRQSG